MKPYNKIKLPETREEWLENRMKGIGGSDAGAIVGVNPWKSPYTLWCEKTGKITNDIDNEVMRQGRDLEQYVAERFCEETGKKVVSPLNAKSIHEIEQKKEQDKAEDVDN